MSFEDWQQRENHGGCRRYSPIPKTSAVGNLSAMDTHQLAVRPLPE